MNANLIVNERELFKHFRNAFESSTHSSFPFKVSGNSSWFTQLTKEDEERYAKESIPFRCTRKNKIYISVHK